MTKKKKQTVPHPYFNRGSTEFAIAMKLATPPERAIWKRFGVAQFAPNDPRLAKIITAPPALSERSRSMMGND